MHKRKNKSVRNHLFILNSIISDVKSSKTKKPIDLSIMDFRQMFDAEQLQTVLNAYYEAGVVDDMFALVNEANETVQFAVKTPTGLTKTAEIRNKIMQGDVLSPLLSSNMVDKNICKMAMFTKNTYWYKGQVEIPPLLMQDDTLAISECGYKTVKTNNFLNTHTNIMGLQFGRDKCVKMHVGKTRQNNICTDCKVDAWKDVLLKHEDGHEELKDTYLGEEVMKNVNNKKYLGSIISNDMGNKVNIVEKTNRGVGFVNKIQTTLIERPYGKYTFKKQPSCVRDYCCHQCSTTQKVG